MNILMALSQLEVTGAEGFATTVGNELSNRGHNVFYVSDTLTLPHTGRYFRLRFNKRSLLRRFWHVGYLIYLIKKHNIQLVHAHSRASSWSSHIACKITKTPLVTTVHGRQRVHNTSKKFHAMGDRALPVCEAIQEQIINDLDVPKEMVLLSRNGIDTTKYTPQPSPENKKPIISIIGRLSGPKGELCYKLLSESLDLNKYHVKIAGGGTLPERFQPFAEQAEFLGFVDDIPSLVAESDLVIGAGRVAMEAALMQRPTYAVGEAKVEGLLTQHTIKNAMRTNFGDIANNILDIDFQQVAHDIKRALEQPPSSEELTELANIIHEHYGLQNIVNDIERHYQSVYVRKLKREMPIIMYHRFIKDEAGKGVHGTYLHVDMLEKHFKLIKKMGLETLTFRDLKDRGLIHRLQPGKRFIMITVDDGYQDNYELLLPLLEKYQLKANIYVVTGENFNRWDVEHPTKPEKKVNLMSPSQIKALHDSGLVEIGGHTLTHPKLDTLTDDEQRKEIIKNKHQLEDVIGIPLCSFAYPYGFHNEASKQIAKEAGYDFAIATDSGPLAMHEDIYQIRRIAIFPRTDTFGLWRKIRGNYVFRKAEK